MEEHHDRDCNTTLRLGSNQNELKKDNNSHVQKQALAGKLSLKPRQVEVWFQNRRARSKLKKTEVDCQFLKKNCERLSEENCRLKKELVELRSKMKIQKPPPATPWPAPQRCSFHVPKVVKLERCPSCEKD
ncbi:Homeobox-leucine zipper protein family [Perilla frutescens var. hirtella]|nr:Homeobox-leucine zipper protein family [Perilla frutescens var. hirtella]